MIVGLEWVAIAKQKVIIADGTTIGIGVDHISSDTNKKANIIGYPAKKSWFNLN